LEYKALLSRLRQCAGQSGQSGGLEYLDYFSIYWKIFISPTVAHSIIFHDEITGFHLGETEIDPNAWYNRW